MIQPARASGMPSAYRSMPAAPGRFHRLSWYSVIGWSFLGMVIVPTALTALYYLFIAAPQFQASVRLAVYAIGKDSGEAAAEFDSADTKSGKVKDKGLDSRPNEPRAGGARQIAGKAMKLMNSVFGNKSDGKDAFIVVNYIRSRTIISDLNQHGWLAKVLSSGEADIVSRLDDDASREKIWRNFNTRVDAKVDSVSRLITVNARAFSPEEANELASRVVAASERLINNIRSRTLKDATVNAAATLQSAEARYLSALAGVRQLRDEVGIIDPAEGALALAKALIELKVVKAALETQYAGIIATISIDSPMARTIAARIAATDAEIADLEKQISGDDADAVTNYLAAFETRETERTLAEAAYEQAVISFDRAQSDADRQGIYLAVFEPPSVPQESRFPRGWRVVLTLFVALSAFWAVLCVAGAGVRDQLAWR